MEAYKITKTIRFKLETAQPDGALQQKADEVKDIWFDFAAFVSELNSFLGNMDMYLFREKKNGEFVVNNSLTVKSEWLKQCAKQVFHDSEARRDKAKRKQTKTIGDFSGLAEEIGVRFDELDEIYIRLADDAFAELNQRARKAQTGLLLKRLAARNSLPYFVSLAENTTDKYETDDLSIRLRNQGRELQERLLLGIQKFLPEQSNGLPVAKASFNYYTINKMPVDYAEKKKEQVDKMMISDFEKQVYEKTSFSKEIKNQIKQDVTDIATLRQKLKNIKALQKAEFNEWMTQDISYEKLKDSKELYLFNNITKTEFDDYYSRTKTIEKKAADIKQATNENRKQELRSSIKRLKKERGSLINAADRRTQSSFKTYKAFAKLYRDFALKHGRILSTIKGIEKEQVESQLIKYWVLVLEANGRHQLVLIPKEKASDAYKWITENEENTVAENKLYWFESFTLRSLRKLCFGYANTGSNTFNENIRGILNAHRYSETDHHGVIKEVRIEGEFSFKGDVQKIINLYKDMLASPYAQKVLNFPKEQVKAELINQRFASLDDFQIAMEKICYRRFSISPKDSTKTLCEKYDAQIFNITTYDLERQSAGYDKHHTQIWKEFWTTENEQRNFDIRINPEITILWRPAKESRIHKYGKGSKLYDETRKNRYLYQQFTLVTTLSEHSNAPTKELSFMTDEEYKKSVQEFNTKIRPTDFKFAFGLDNGEAELSTLGAYFPEFSKSTYAESIEELKNVNEYGFKVLTIKNLSHKETDINGKERKIIQNPSYFLNKAQYVKTFGKSETEFQQMFAVIFEEKNLLTLDLTTAKIINGHIVTNGDVPTFFNLWMRHAQRHIWDMNDHTQKKTAKKITLKNNAELTEAEKVKFVEYLNTSRDNKKYAKLSKQEKEKYTQWIYGLWDRKPVVLSGAEEAKYEEIKKNQRVGYFSRNILFAVCYIGEYLQSVTEVFDVRNVFKLHKDFYVLKSEKEIREEFDEYNNNESQQQISNEELDLKINHLRQAIVANAIGVIDWLYKYYKAKTGGEGLIVKEGLDTGKVADDLEKFSGNIYRILERKLYQKFQNYGLVPPIKSLLSVRGEGLTDKKDMIIQLGNIGFVDPSGTSQNCPVCATKFGGHQDIFVCNTCNFTPGNIMHSNDGVAGYNIAQRGFANVLKANHAD